MKILGRVGEMRRSTSDDIGMRIIHLALTPAACERSISQSAGS